MKVVDLFGDINEDGSGTTWEYEDSFATRNADVASASATFTQAEWTVALYGPEGFVTGEAGDECSDGPTNNCDSNCATAGRTRRFRAKHCKDPKAKQWRDSCYGQGKTTCSDNT
eukprot:SAG31_NODE_5788_length_2328_cov_2.213997_2_plen_114_part_00